MKDRSKETSRICDIHRQRRVSSDHVSTWHDSSGSDFLMRDDFGPEDPQKKLQLIHDEKLEYFFSFLHIANKIPSAMLMVTAPS